MPYLSGYEASTPPFLAAPLPPPPPDPAPPPPPPALKVVREGGESAYGPLLRPPLQYNPRAGDEGDSGDKQC